MIRLFYNQYTDPVEARNDELVVCEGINTSNPFIYELYPISGRPTFREIFQYVNDVIEDGDIAIICNSDIHFDHTLTSVGIIGENECYALSRWDVKENLTFEHFNREDSQDAWIFRGKIKDVPDCDFGLGVAGNDNAIAERLQRAGYTVTNPSLTIRALHLHLSGVRRHGWRNAVPKPYLYVKPTTL